jgi:hypothetical protein
MASIDDVEKIKALTSSEAIETYKAGVKFEQLGAIVDDAKKFKVLTSKESLVKYKKGISFMDVEAEYEKSKIPVIEAKSREAGENFSETRQQKQESWVEKVRPDSPKDVGHERR